MGEHSHLPQMELRRETLLRSPLKKRRQSACSAATGSRKAAKGAGGRGRGRPRGSTNGNGWDAVRRQKKGGARLRAMHHGTGSRKRSASAAFAGSGEHRGGVDGEDGARARDAAYLSMYVE
eukprot:COSAG04_NODE_2060_length_4886_cov_26.697096_1_plen_121_part_00